MDYCKFFDGSFNLTLCYLHLFDLVVYLCLKGNQLLKDRRKNKRKRRVSGEIFPASASASAHSQGKVSCNDNRLVKVVVRDSQNIQKSGSGKASSLKRNANIGVNRGNCKGDLFSLKTARLRRKPGNFG